MNNRKPLERSKFKAKTSPKKINFLGEPPLRILSLDGGGIKGVFTAAYLAKLEELLDREPIGNYFDMVAGTSTGGIIALGFAKGLSARELKSLYVENGPAIFPKDRWTAKKLSKVGTFVHRLDDGKIKDAAMLLHDAKFSKFDNQPLFKLMEEIVGNAILGESKVALCIPSVNAERNEPAIFKTPHHPDFKLDWNKTMLEVGMGTSAAPTYFKPSTDDDYILLDGALIGNNPIMVAVVDVLSRFQVDSNNIRVLSIGTGSFLPPLTKNQIEGSGMWDWKNAHEHFNFYQSKNALGQACLMIGPQNVFRIEPKEENRGIDLADHERAIGLLPEDAEQQALQDYNDLKSVFFEKPSAGMAFFYGPRSSDRESA